MGGRFTDGRVPKPGIRELFLLEHRWQRWLDVEAALAAAEADAGIVPVEAADAIAAAATVTSLDLGRVRQNMLAISHPLMALVTELSDVVGDPHAGWVHWGATTQNITQSGDMLVLREAHQRFLAMLAQVLTAAGELAERGADMVAPGRTHGQQAVPITFGFKVAAWIDELGRHVQRLHQVEDRVFTAMLGGAVGNFASLGAAGPAVQAGVAARLGLEPMAVPSRAVNDAMAEYVCVLALLAGTGGKIAGEIYTLMKTEIGEADEPAPAGTVGSSTMPHKRNPQLADDCITISAQIRALVPLALEGMLHDHEVNGANSAMMDDAIERACVLTGDLLTRLHVILAGLELHESRMRANLDVTGGLITSEAVMLALGHAIGRQAAHEVIYEAADATRHGVTFSDALKSDRRVMDHIPPEDLEVLLDPRARVGLSAELARDAARRAYDLAQELTQEARPMPR